MLVSTSSALNSGFFKTFLMRSTIAVAVRECFSAYAFKMCSLPVMTSAASLSRAGKSPPCSNYNIKHRTRYRIRYRIELHRCIVRYRYTISYIDKNGGSWFSGVLCVYCAIVLPRLRLEGISQVKLVPSEEWEGFPKPGRGLLD